LNRDEVLALFDREMRIDPPRTPGCRLERVGTVVRLIGEEEHCILYARPLEAEAARVVAEQVADLRPRGQVVEWKIYSHDEPAVLPRLLSQAGFVAKPHETLMVFDLREELPPGKTCPGLEVRRIHDPAGFEDLVAVDTGAFGGVDRAIVKEVRKRLKDPLLGIFVAYLDGHPVSAGRVEVDAGRSFAGLFGGGTIPDFRGRGIYHHLVRARAEFARQHGSRYLTVEALDTTSRPILERVGFAPLAGVEGWVLTPGAPSASSPVGDR
jgi:GNAT superfamily N-acetyltransferase